MWSVTHAKKKNHTTHHGGEKLKLKLLFGPLKLLKLENRCKRREIYKMAVFTAIIHLKSLFANTYFELFFTKEMIFPTKQFIIILLWCTSK